MCRPCSVFRRYYYKIVDYIDGAWDCNYFFYFIMTNIFLNKYLFMLLQVFCVVTCIEKEFIQLSIISFLIPMWIVFFLIDDLLYPFLLTVDFSVLCNIFNSYLWTILYHCITSVLLKSSIPCLSITMTQQKSRCILYSIVCMHCLLCY